MLDRKNIKFSYMIILIVIFSLFFYSEQETLATEMPKEDAAKALVVFSNKNGEINDNLLKLDLLIGHFTDQIEFKPCRQVKTTDLEQATHLIYYGEQEETLPKDFSNLIEQYEGTIVAIGYNARQLGDRFLFMEFLYPEVSINQVVSQYLPDKRLSFSPQFVFRTNIVHQQHAQPLLMGDTGVEQYPLFIKYDQSYYFASPDISDALSLTLAEGLSQVFGRKEPAPNYCYIRLEDIHPLVNPKDLMAIARILQKKGIPYMMAVIPVYTNPQTGKQYHFSDSPELLNVLKYMQKNGGSVILHGYTHQFRLSETGEGFEFWDVEYNMPIYHRQEEEVSVKKREEFGSEKEYEHYLGQQKAFERNYIETRLTKGIQELVNYGLFPLAFEAPHYAMSQHGYRVVSDFFSTYVGNVQLSDKDWENTASSPCITKPVFLHGITLLPETMGYVDPDDPRAIAKMLSRSEDYRFVREGILGGFYHPYLGVDLFLELIEPLENIPNTSWIDLKQMNNRVTAAHVDIRTEKGRLIKNINRPGLIFSSTETFLYQIRKAIKKIAWAMAGLGSLGVVFCISGIYICFKERKTICNGEKHA